MRNTHITCFQAVHFSSLDKIGSVVQKGIEAAQALVKNEPIDVGLVQCSLLHFFLLHTHYQLVFLLQELLIAKTSLHSQMEIIIGWDKHRFFENF